jgi:CubicO group peptidase (beta-lactamase class C family)
MRLVVIALLLLMMAAPVSAVQRPPPRDLESLRARIAEVLARNGVAGVGLALVTRERVLWAGGVGLADRAAHKPVTQDTLFRVGSITKSFVSLALIKLAEEGRLDLNARISDLAPELKIENRWHKEAPITVAHLLEHTAGFDDMHPNEMYGPISVENLSLREILARNPASRVARWRPGSRFSYANPGYTVAAYVIEKASGRPWADYVRDEILLPLGMRTAALRWSADVERKLSRGYEDGPDALPYRAIYHFPAGNLMASPRELAALAQLWLGRGRINDRQLISPAGIARMERSETAAIRGLDIDYGFGNYGETWQRARTRGHDGGIDGFLSACHYLPERGVGFVMLLNGTGTHAFDAYVQTRQLIVDFLVGDAALPLPPPVDVDARELRTWQGDYGFASPRQQLFAFLMRLAPALRLSFKNGRLYLSEQPNPPFEVALVPLGDGKFRFPQQVGSHVAVARDGEGRRTLLVNGAFLVEQPRWVAPLCHYGVRAILWLLLSAVTLPIAALLWRRRGVAVGWRWPMLAAVSFFATPFLFLHAATLRVVGERNVFTMAICAATIGFAVSAIVVLLQSLRGLAQPLPVILKLHRMLIGVAAVTAAIYLASYHLIGICLWRY